ncbi:hypothetical protein LPJ77_006538, partial [Coemansia sp. RSA 2523]
HLVYETSLPKPYRIVHVDPDGDGDDAENPDDMDWINKGREERAKRMIRLKITVDESNQVHEVESDASAILPAYAGDLGLGMSVLNRIDVGCIGIDCWYAGISAKLIERNALSQS